MREVGPVRKGLDGDEAVSAAYMSQARMYLGMLKAQMAPLKIQVLSRTINLSDGTTIYVASIFGQDVVRITVPQAVPVAVAAEELVTPPVLVGIPLVPLGLYDSVFDVLSSGRPAMAGQHPGLTNATINAPLFASQLVSYVQAYLLGTVGPVMQFDFNSRLMWMDTSGSALVKQWSAADISSFATASGPSALTGDTRTWDFSSPPNNITPGFSQLTTSFLPPFTPIVLRTPDTGTVYNSAVVPVLSSPLVVPVGAAYLAVKTASTQFINGVRVDNTSALVGDYQAGTNRQETYLVGNSDGSISTLSGGSASISYQLAVGNSIPANPDMQELVLYGANGLVRDYPTLGPTALVDPWTDSDPALGYSVARHLPLGISADREAYDILYAGTTKRSAVRARTSIGNNPGLALELSYVQTPFAVPPDDAAANVVRTFSTTAWQSSPFVGHDAPVSICDDILVVVTLGANVPIADTTIVLLPLGWSAKSATAFKALELFALGADDLADVLSDILASFNTALNFNAASATLLAYVNQATQLLATPGSQGDALQSLLALLTPDVLFLQGKSVSAEVALTAGPGTFFLVPGV
jgi:hypothetical protein